MGPLGARTSGRGAWTPEHPGGNRPSGSPVPSRDPAGSDPGEGAPPGVEWARAWRGAHLFSSAFIKSCLEIDGREYRRGNRSAQSSNLLALNSE